MHGAVAPLDVMMQRLFNISQNKGEHVSQFVTRLETTLNNIQRDHPGQLTQATIQNSLRDRFYQGLKKAHKDSLCYLYAAVTGCMMTINYFEEPQVCSVHSPSFRFYAVTACTIWKRLHRSGPHLPYMYQSCTDHAWSPTG